MKKGSLKNISNKSDADFNDNEAKLTPSKEIEVKARNLSDTANTNISITTVFEDSLGASTINAENLRDNNLVIKDASGATTNLMTNSDFKNKITLEFEGGKKQLKVQYGNTYKAIIKGDGTNIIGSREVEFKVIAHNIDNATFAHENAYKGEHYTYTGEKITCGLTAANLREKLGDLTMPNANKPLIPGQDYDVNVEFGENINAGEGQIIINGKNSYAGSQKVIKFNI